MSVFADIVIVAILLLALILGAKRGLIQTLAGLAVVVVAFFGAAWVAKALADPVARWLQPLLESRIAERLQTQSASATPGGMLAAFGYSGRTLTELAQQVADQVRQTGQSLLSAVVSSVLHSVAYAAVYVLAFLVLLLVLRLVVKSLDLAADLPGLRTVNGLGGAVLGLIKGLLLVFLLVWAMQKLRILITPQMVEESMLLPFFVNNSPVTLIASLWGEIV